MEEQYTMLERKFDTLASDVHLPFLEVSLYRKYFVEVKTEDKLQGFAEVCNALSDHRMGTLKLLKLIHEREGVMEKITEKADEFSKGKLTTLEVQTTVLQLLHAHQTVTLQFVECLKTWRENLTRPYPFQWRGKNYISKINDDCAFLDQSSLRTVLPLRVTQFPLCSNITSLNLFASEGKEDTGTGDRVARLRAAETIVFEEDNIQRKLLGELQGVAAEGRFVPLLLLPHLIPQCQSGIRISRADWDQQLKSALNAAGQGAGDSPRSSRSRTPTSGRSSARSSSQGSSRSPSSSRS